VLAGAGGATSTDGASRFPPLFDPAFLDTLPFGTAPTLSARFLPALAAKRALEALARPLDDAYGLFAGRLRVWGTARVEENVEWADATRVRGTDRTAPELRSLAALVDSLFPSPPP
jgi:hypothetical protein